MALTDRRGRTLVTFLVAEVTGSDTTQKEVMEWMGIKPARWHGNATRPGRAEADDFPNPTELHRLAKALSFTDADYINLLVEFGWVASDTIPGLTGFTSERDRPVREPTTPRATVRTDRPTL